MADTYMADISEFQVNIEAPAYLASYSCLIIRVHNGNRPDRMMPNRLAYLRGYPFKALGLYQYLVPDRNPADQAKDFINTVGRLRVNEYPILDLEQGPGDQTTRAQAWFDVVDYWANFRATLYSGLSYLSTNLGGAGRWKGRPIWVAAYGQSEPRVPHILWQYSDSVSFPGITPGRCDGSIHHGDAKSYVYDIRHAAGGGGLK